MVQTGAAGGQFNGAAWVSAVVMMVEPEPGEVVKYESGGMSCYSSGKHPVVILQMK